MDRLLNCGDEAATPAVAAFGAPDAADGVADGADGPAMVLLLPP